MNEMGIRLKNAIKNSNLTQKEIAELINLSQKQISFYTQGKADITVKTLKSICDIINVPIQEIINGIDENNINEILVSKFNKLTEEQQERVIEQIELYELKNSKMSQTSENIKDVSEEKNRTG